MGLDGFVLSPICSESGVGSVTVYYPHTTFKNASVNRHVKVTLPKVYIADSALVS